MRRLFAFVVALALAAAPALHFWCESSCGVPPKDTVASGCHEEPASSGPTLTSAHDCLTHAQTPALAVLPVSTLYALMPAVVPFGIAGTASHLTSALPDPDVSPFDNSPPRSHLPLRI
jgi:hypothetical protein